MAFLTKISTTRWYLPDADNPGRRREAKPHTPGATKCRVKGSVYYLVHTEAGKKKFVPTGLTDLRAAQKYLADWNVAKERGETGLSDPRQRHLDAPIGNHVAEYLATLAAGSDTHRREVARVLGLATSPMKSLRDLTAERITKHLSTTPSAATGNKHRAYLSGFAGWCFRLDYLAANPILRVGRLLPGANDPTPRTRRAYTVDELRRLLAAARDYPVASRTQAKGGRPRKDGTPAQPRVTVASLTPGFARQLGLAGKEREIVYRALLATGLRRGELSRIRVSMFDGSKLTVPKQLLKHKPKKLKHVVFHVPVELAKDLEQLVIDTDKRPGDKLVHVPTHSNYVKEHQSRLRLAGVAYETPVGFADLHALRTTGNHYLKGNRVPLHKRQRFLRHAASDITTKHYDPEATTARTMERKVFDLMTKLDAEITRPKV